MNTRHTALLAAALSAAACAAPPAAEPATAQQMADLINQACALGRTCGKTYYPAAPPLKWNPLLEKAAAAHAQDMADKNYFRHESPDGRDMAERVEQAGYRYRAVGENILAGEPTARAAIDTWLAAPGHCKNIMNPAYTEVGMAYAANEHSQYGVYWVQNFGSLAGK